MSLRIKKLLLEKLNVLNTDTRVALKNLNQLHISYKHEDKCFIVQASKSIVQQTGNINNNVLSKTSDIISAQIDREVFLQNVLTNDIEQAQPIYTSNPKKIVIDFSSPNIAKPFHVGHLRSTVIGNFIANINKYFGNQVTKINYLGDWGTQFGLLQFGLNEKNINLDQLTSDPIKKLYDIYVYANKLSSANQDVHKQAMKYFSDIEHGNGDLANWKKIREVTLKELELIYQRLGIQFDEYHWESDYNGGAIKSLLLFLEKQNIMETDEMGKKIAKIKNGKVSLLKSDNSTLYLSRDIAALLDRYNKYNFDKMLYVVDNAQTSHFMALFEIIDRVNDACAERCEHIKFGRIKGMSTRAGNVVFLNDILDEAKTRMVEKQKLSKNTRNTAMNDQTCDILGTTAVIINDLKQRRLRDYDFDWNRALQSDGDSGIKLQYLHCRLWSLEQNCGVSLPDVCEPKYLTEDIIGEVVAELARFESVLHRAHIDYEACIIVNYLFRLAKHVNKMFNDLRVKDVNPHLGAQRLLVFHSVRLVVKTALEILGVKPLCEM